MDMWTNLIVSIISQYKCISNHHIYTLNLHNVICQIYLNLEKAARIKKKDNTNSWWGCGVIGTQLLLTNVTASFEKSVLQS